MSIQTQFTLDTEYSADSVEWCPIDISKDVIAVGTYQVDKSDEVSFSPSQRKGRLYALKYNLQDTKIVQQMETAPILDMKWCPNTMNNCPILATADAHGKITLFKLENDKLEHLSDLCVMNEPDVLVLSLDFSNRKDPSEAPFIVVSTSKGDIAVIKVLNGGKTLQLESGPQNAHSFEAWIAAYNCWNSKMVFSGGDDMKLRAFSTEDGELRSAFIIGPKEHLVGVTCLLSDIHKEHILYSGSYDEHLRTWDLRYPKQCVESVQLEAGLWRIRQPNYDTNLLATATMLGGFHVLNKSPLEVLHRFTEHDSLAYGIDWCPEEAANVLASCSFYDHVFKIWHFKDSK